MLFNIFYNVEKGTFFFMKGYMDLFAPAKVNLFLHITGQRPDGYHTLDSLVIFTKDVGDQLTLQSNDRASNQLSLSGEFHFALQNDLSENLILQAATQFSKITSTSVHVHFHLQKNLPIASGIGGGSSDAAACLNGLSQMSKYNNPTTLKRLAEGLGADIPVCLNTRPTLMRGIGDDLTPLTQIPEFYIVLANPLIPLPTKNIFSAYHDTNTQYSKTTVLETLPTEFSDFISFLSDCQNDLTKAACQHCPEINTVINEISKTPHCLLSRMSGSGATCFGIYETLQKAQKAEAILQKQQPNWWIKSSRIITD